MATELRPDIAAAKAKLTGGTLGSGRELKKLPEHLAPGELVEYLATGRVDNGAGLLALTDRRLLFLRDGLLSKSTEEFFFDRITSVAWSSGMLLGKITVATHGGNHIIDGVPKSDGKLLVDALREILHDRLNQVAAAELSPAGREVPQPDVYDQLRKLAELHEAGVVSAEEYATKRAELLARI
jgi:hypothetical protein